MTSIKKALVVAGAAIALTTAPAWANGTGDCFNKTTGEYEPCPGDWSGFYAGGSVGGRNVDAEWTPTSVTTNVGVPIPAVGGADFSTVDFDDWSARIAGFVGYNFHLAPEFLVGVEAEVGMGGNDERSVPIPGFQTLDAARDSSALLEGLWDASLRLRAGFLATDDFLLYATGGVAFQNMRATTTCLSAAATPPCAGTTAYGSEDDEILTGYTIGGGLEYMLFEDVTVRGEYRYSDYGDFTVNGPIATPVFAFGASHDVDVRTHTGLVGIAVQF